MRIAVLSDIHGNAAALQAVLAEARTLGAERLFVLGDLVGYYYHPAEALRLLEDWPVDMIQGNHEAMLQSVRNGNLPAGEVRKKYGSGIDRALTELDGPSLARLLQLPEQTTVSLEGVSFALCHGSPWDRDEYIYPDAPSATLRRCADGAADFVLLGHTHHPFVVGVNSVTVANAGSVGQARNRSGCADWILVDTSNRALVFQRTAYDASGIVSEVKSVDPHLPYLHEVLTGRRGTSPAIIGERT